jgi:hypothetical protein
VIDVSRAYFYAKCQRPLYIQIPHEDWEYGDEYRVGKLHLSLYGTRDAAQNWAATYTEYLNGIGFTQGRASLCNFRHEKRDIDLTVHGDDFMIVADSENLKWMEERMKAAYEVKCSMLGPEPGMSKEVRILNRTLRWTSSGIEYEPDPKHAKIVIKECEVEASRSSKIPGARKEDDERGGALLSSTRASQYRAVVARLNYLAADRMDLQYSTKNLSRQMANPTEADWEQVKRTARYLKHRPRAVQKFNFEAPSSELSGFADSDWAGEKPSMKSTSGGLLMWGTTLLKSWSVTQSTVAVSSAEAELYALSKCAQQALCLASLAGDFNMKFDPVVRSDASAALGIVYRSGLGGKTRHVKVQYLWIQGAVQRGDLAVAKVQSRDNPADALTKYLSSDVLYRHVSAAGLVFPEQGTNKLAAAELECLRLVVKHDNLAAQQRQILSRIRAEAQSSVQGGVSGMAPLRDVGTYSPLSHSICSSVGICLSTAVACT